MPFAELTEAAKVFGGTTIALLWIGWLLWRTMSERGKEQKTDPVMGVLQAIQKASEAQAKAAEEQVKETRALREMMIGLQAELNSRFRG